MEASQTLNRVEFLQALTLVEPALSSNKNQVEELSYLWFDGQYLSAYDDVIGIRVTFPTKFTGGVPGDKLVGVLRNSRAKNVGLHVEDENLLLRVGAAQVKLTVKPIEDWFWKPEIPERDGYALTQQFIAALDGVMVSVGTGKVMTAEQRGVTVIQQNGSAELYSTDRRTLSHTKVEADVYKGSNVRKTILPTAFCERLCKDAPEGAALRFDGSGVYCSGPMALAGDLKFEDYLLFSRLVEEEEGGPDFSSTIKNFTQDKGTFDIPSRLKLALDRACVLLAEEESAQLSLEKDEKTDKEWLAIEAVSAYGQVEDSLALERITKHEAISVRVNPKLLQRGLAGRKVMTLTKSAVVMWGPGESLYVVATS